MRDTLKWTKHAQRRRLPDKSEVLDPCCMMIAASERAWASRAVAEQHLAWVQSNDAVMLPGDSFTFAPAHAFDPIHFSVLQAGSHLKHRTKSFPADGVLDNLGSSVAAIRDAGLQAIERAIDGGTTPPERVIDAVEALAMDSSHSAAERGRALQLLRAKLSVRAAIAQALIEEWALSETSPLHPSKGGVSPAYALVTDNVAGMDHLFELIRIATDTAPTIVRDSIIAMRFHLQERPLEVHELRARNWVEFAERHEALCPEVVADLRRSVRG